MHTENSLHQSMFKPPAYDIAEVEKMLLPKRALDLETLHAVV